MTGLLLLRKSWWAILLAPVLAVVSTQTAFFGHDAGHRQITRRRGASETLGLFTGNLLNGLSYTRWVDKHNAHHAHPNDLTSDPDMHPGATQRQAKQPWCTTNQLPDQPPMATGAHCQDPGRAGQTSRGDRRQVSRG